LAKDYHLGLRAGDDDLPADDDSPPGQVIGPRRFLVFLIDPKAEPETNSEALSAALGITSTEAVLALALLNDRSINDYAEERGISNNTARVQLRSLMKNRKPIGKQSL
jgi:hypothetical protein